MMADDPGSLTEWTGPDRAGGWMDELDAIGCSLGWMMDVLVGLVYRCGCHHNQVEEEDSDDDDDFLLRMADLERAR